MGGVYKHASIMLLTEPTSKGKTFIPLQEEVACTVATMMSWSRGGGELSPECLRHGASNLSSATDLKKLLEYFVTICEMQRIEVSILPLWADEQQLSHQTGDKPNTLRLQT